MERYQIPEYWDWKKLGDLCQTTSGGTPSRRNSHFFQGTIPWVKSGELTDGAVTEVEEYITQEAVQNSSAKVFPKGTLLLAMYGATVGKLGILGKNAATNQAVCAIFPSFEVENQFLFWFLRRCRPELLALSAGGAQPNISQKIIRELEVPIPYTDDPTRSLAEQRRIVARIEAIFAELRECRALNEKIQTSTNRVMESLLKEEFGTAVQPGWVPLSTYVQKIENGKSPTAESRPATGKEWGVLKVGCVSYGYFKADENKALFPDYTPLPQYEVQSGDFLMSRANTLELVGACAVVREVRPHLMLSDKIFRFIFRKNSHLDRSFLDYVMKSAALRGQIETVATGTSPSMKNISKAKVLELKIPQYDLLQQRAIAAKLTAAQSEVVAMQRGQNDDKIRLKQIEQGILTQAFRGEL
jgi:type I restriction enzyme S subunit